MKRKNSAHESAAKRQSAPKTVDEYLARVPEPGRSTLEQIRSAIRSAVPPEATETISYGIPAFKYKGTLVWFAAFAKHCSFFPTSSVIAAFKDDLKGFTTSIGNHSVSDRPSPAERPGKENGQGSSSAGRKQERLKQLNERRRQYSRSQSRPKIIRHSLSANFSTSHARFHRQNRVLCET